MHWGRAGDRRWAGAGDRRRAGAGAWHRAGAGRDWSSLDDNVSGAGVLLSRLKHRRDSAAVLTRGQIGDGRGSAVGRQVACGKMEQIGSVERNSGAARPSKQPNTFPRPLTVGIAVAVAGVGEDGATGHAGSLVVGDGPGVGVGRRRKGKRHRVCTDHRASDGGGTCGQGLRGSW